MFPAFDARRQQAESAHRDGNASIMELKASDKGSKDRLVLEQREFHANADPGSFREGEEAATPAVTHLVRRGDPILSQCAVLGFPNVNTLLLAK